jgi:hypothetical protein
MPGWDGSYNPGWDGSYNIVHPHVAAEEMARKTYGRYDNDGNCFECGAFVDDYNKRTQHNAFHTNFIHRAEVKDGVAVSAVKWCDAGNHAFKANAPGSQSVDVVQRDDDGREERVVMDMCAEHAFSTGRQTRPAIEAPMSESELQERYNKLMQERLATPMNSDVSPFED